MFVYVGVCLLAFVIILSILLICGLPLGELTMGGRYKVWPKEFMIIAVGQLAVQLFAVFFVLNTFMNFTSLSKKEKYIMTPMSAIEAICFCVAGFHM